MFDVGLYEHVMSKYGAVIPLYSTSFMLLPYILDMNHYITVYGLQKVFQNYKNLQSIIVSLGMSELSGNSKLIVACASKIQRFLSQPFHVETIFIGVFELGYCLKSVNVMFIVMEVLKLKSALIVGLFDAKKIGDEFLVFIVDYKDSKLVLDNNATQLTGSTTLKQKSSFVKGIKSGCMKLLTLLSKPYHVL